MTVGTVYDFVRFNPVSGVDGKKDGSRIGTNDRRQFGHLMNFFLFDFGRLTALLENFCNIKYNCNERSIRNHFQEGQSRVAPAVKGYCPESKVDGQLQ